MKIYSNANIKPYEIEKLGRIFLPFESFEFLNEPSSDCELLITKDDNKTTASLTLGGDIAEFSNVITDSEEKEEQLETAAIVYRCFSKILNYSSPWGILTGVRPAKLFLQKQRLLGEQKAEEYFRSKLLVTPQKTELCRAAIKGEEQIISLSKPDSFSLYIGIPFCPSRCSYCSFVSHSVEHAEKLIPKYVDLLCKEIKLTGEIARKLRLRLETVYIGGGTPTTLSAAQLESVMKAIKSSFDLSTMREFTVEAGRPDTITEEKLAAIKSCGATRISVNPQTMNDEVLKTIGRRHTAKQTVNAFYAARKAGFNNINMDLIAGLPSDNPESFLNSVTELLKLDPESITVHTLCLKRSANLSENDGRALLKRGDETARMLDIGSELLKENKLMPYYMYRQSKMVGNLENVGYAKRGFEGLYNVCIMDETHSILACGGSAVTKLKAPHKNEIERIYNFKYPYEYIERFDEQIKRKERILSFYDNGD